MIKRFRRIREISRELVSMVTTGEESKPDLDHLKSKMIRFPEEILMAQLAPLSTNQSFRPDMQHYEFQISKTTNVIKNQCTILDCSIFVFERNPV